MVKTVESNCVDSLYESITYICDKCNKSLKITTYDEFDKVDKMFDVDGPGDKLYCKKCVKEKK